MKTIVLISAIAEWQGIKLLFPDEKIDHFPFGECFDAVINNRPISFLKSKGALAADWESAALAWVAQWDRVPLLILHAVSDLVGEHGGDAYGDIEIFNERAKLI